MSNEVNHPFDLPTHLRPKTGTAEAWNTAYGRVEDYIRAHRIHNRLHQLQLLQVVMKEAAKRHAENPQIEPTVIAAEVIETMMDEWFTQVLNTPNQPHERIAVDGRVALLICDGPSKWPYAFLQTTDLPADFIENMRERSLEAGPDLSLSSMVPRPIDLGIITEAAGETLERVSKWPIVKTLILWVLFLGALIALFRLTR
jgi:hypothetical protein